MREDVDVLAALINCDCMTTEQQFFSQCAVHCVEKFAAE